MGKAKKNKGLENQKNQYGKNTKNGKSEKCTCDNKADC